jgi:hypothetical protein
MPSRFILAKSCEAVGLTVVALALLVGLGEGDMGRELLILAAGAGIFLLGYALESRQT